MIPKPTATTNAPAPEPQGPGVPTGIQMPGVEPQVSVPAQPPVPPTGVALPQGVVPDHVPAHVPAAAAPLLQPEMTAKQLADLAAGQQAGQRFQADVPNVANTPGTAVPGNGVERISDTVTLHEHGPMVQMYRTIKGFVAMMKEGDHELSLDKLKRRFRELTKSALLANPGVKKVEFIGLPGSAPVVVGQKDTDLEGNRLNLNTKEKMNALVDAIGTMATSGMVDLLQETKTVTLKGEVAEWFIENSYKPTYGELGAEQTQVPAGLKVAIEHRLTPAAVKQLQAICWGHVQATDEVRDAATRLLHHGLADLSVS